MMALSIMKGCGVLRYEVLGDVKTLLETLSKPEQENM
jgi:hypothetical protein